MGLKLDLALLLTLDDRYEIGRVNSEYKETCRPEQRRVHSSRDAVCLSLSQVLYFVMVVRMGCRSGE